MSELSEQDRKVILGNAYTPLPSGGSNLSMYVMAGIIVLVLVAALSADFVMSWTRGSTMAGSPAGAPVAAKVSAAPATTQH